MVDAVFERDGDRCVPTKHAGSPWADDLLHGGPPAGLLARAVENLAATEEMRVARLTIDAVVIADGIEVSRASGLLLRATELPGIRPGGTMLPPSLGEADPDPPIRSFDMPRREGFHTASVIRRLPRTETGPSIAWIRVPQLIEGETMSPLVRLAATCDFVNAVGSMGSLPGGMGFINTDSTIYIHRLPIGEWICLQVERSVEPYGIGVSSAVLYDQDGSVGRAAQAVLANQMR
jgi:hypothetical protein